VQNEQLMGVWLIAGLARLAAEHSKASPSCHARPLLYTLLLLLKQAIY
jgi:hypothetical protein